MKRLIVLLLLTTCYLHGQELFIPKDTLTQESVPFKKPFTTVVTDTLHYKTYISDSLQLALRFTDSLIVMETTYQGNPVMNIGAKNMVHNINKTTFGVINTHKTTHPFEEAKRDITAFTLGQDTNIKNLEYGKNLLNGEEAFWLKLTTVIDGDKTFSSLVYYVIHPKNQTLYMIYISTYAPENYNEELRNYYNFLETLKWQ